VPCWLSMSMYLASLAIALPVNPKR